MHMFRPAQSRKPAVAVIAAAIFIVATACSGGGDDQSPATDTATGDPSASPTIPGDLRDVDLATDTNALQIGGVDAEDLLTGTTSMATGDFDDDGETDLLIGAPQGDGPDDDRPDAGEAYLIFGPLDHSVDLGARRADVVIYGAAAGDGRG